jgi:hypothetical protein
MGRERYQDLSPLSDGLTSSWSSAAHRSGTTTKLATTSWLFVAFGEHQVMAQLIAKRVLISSWMNRICPFAILSSLMAMLLP